MGASSSFRLDTNTVLYLLKRNEYNRSSSLYLLLTKIKAPAAPNNRHGISTHNVPDAPEILSFS